MATCIYRGAFARYPIVTTSGSPGRCLPRNAVKTEIHFLSLPFLALPSLFFSFSFSISFSFKHTFFPPRSSIPPLCDPYTRACFPVTHEIISQNLSRTATSPSVSFSPYLETDSRSSRNFRGGFLSRYDRSSYRACKIATALEPFVRRSVAFLHRTEAKRARFGTRYFHTARSGRGYILYTRKRALSSR